MRRADRQQEQLQLQTQRRRQLQDDLQASHLSTLYMYPYRNIFRRTTETHKNGSYCHVIESDRGEGTIISDSKMKDMLSISLSTSCAQVY